MCQAFLKANLFISNKLPKIIMNLFISHKRAYSIKCHHLQVGKNKQRIVEVSLDKCLVMVHVGNSRTSLLMYWTRKKHDTLGVFFTLRSNLYWYYLILITKWWINAILNLISVLVSNPGNQTTPHCSIWFTVVKFFSEPMVALYFSRGWFSILTFRS